MTAHGGPLLDQLRRDVVAPQSMALAMSGITLRPDPAGKYIGTWSSPRGRLLEIDITPQHPGAWLGLHVPWPLPDLSALGWIGFAARSNAQSIMATRACLRSGTDSGFHDQFFAVDIISDSAATDHFDLMSPQHLSDLPPQAPWRELVFFLPPAKPFRWALQDLRLIAL
jgi:hypothetical protein